MSLKHPRRSLVIASIITIVALFYLNLEDYQEQRIHMLINDFLLSIQ